MQSNIPHPHQLILKPFSYNLVCDACRKNGGTTGEQSFHCQLCDIDICKNCANKLKAVQNSKHVHQLTMIKKRGGSFTCDGCNEKFFDTASMNCANCNFNLCLKCYLAN